MNIRNPSVTYLYILSMVSVTDMIAYLCQSSQEDISQILFLANTFWIQYLIAVIPRSCLKLNEEESKALD